MKIHIVGDSHTLIFNGLKEPFVVQHIGPFTAFNLKKKKAFWDYIEKIEQGDKLIMVFGEIDARIHIYYQHKLTGLEIEELILNTIEHYDEVLADIKQRGIDFAVYNIVPPGNINDYPVFEEYAGGSDADTLKIKADFNKALKERCRIKGYKFIDALPRITDETGHVLSELRGEIDHLNPDAVAVILPEIEKAFGLELYQSLVKNKN